MQDVITEWQNREHALAYLAKADSITNRTHGERMVLDLVPSSVRRVLDLGTGDGRLMGLLLIDRPRMTGLAVDFSPTMLASVRPSLAAVSGEVPNMTAWLSAAFAPATSSPRMAHT